MSENPPPLPACPSGGAALASPILLFALHVVHTDANRAHCNDLAWSNDLAWIGSDQGLDLQIGQVANWRLRRRRYQQPD